MFLWFAGLSLVMMWFVFRDPAIDHRLVVLGALLPDLVDAPFGHAAVAHTLLGAVFLLYGVMAVTVRRRRLRRRLLALPIGVFFHLVLDPIWTVTAVFWWPVQGLALGDHPIPAFDRPLGVAIAMEVVGALSLMWVWYRFGLADPTRRSVFLRTGRLDRALTEPGHQPPSC